mmetsp:Transcript_28452/g.83695  ORF Transcript_28452/g.83695 Transcript_28452/m.83695 type:complete len:81 (-) Transcript_28452:813-1055(-)
MWRQGGRSGEGTGGIVPDGAFPPPPMKALPIVIVAYSSEEVIANHLQLTLLPRILHILLTSTTNLSEVSPYKIHQNTPRA